MHHSLYRVNSRDQAKGASLGGKSIHLLSHIASPKREVLNSYIKRGK